MVDRNLIREFNIDEDEFEATFAAALQEGMEALPEGESDLDYLYHRTSSSFEVGSILPGTVLRFEGDDVLVDVGYKSEGVVPANEWDEGEPPPVPGQRIEVLLEEVEMRQRPGGALQAQGRPHPRLGAGHPPKHKEGDVVNGAVIRKIKGGLLVDIGVPVFLPASQVDIRRPADIGEYIGQEIECKILKIDAERRNIVVSRRKLIEEQRARQEDQAPGARSRSGQHPQGRGQEHRRLRRVRRPGRHRRPAAHHRHELGPHRPSQRDGRRSTRRSRS